MNRKIIIIQRWRNGSILNIESKLQGRQKKRSGVSSLENVLSFQVNRELMINFVAHFDCILSHVLSEPWGLYKSLNRLPLDLDLTFVGMISFEIGFQIILHSVLDRL